MKNISDGGMLHYVLTDVDSPKVVNLSKRCSV